MKSDIQIPREEVQPRWHWRNCRSLGVTVGFWLWPWGMSFERDGDLYGQTWSVGIGPFVFQLHASIGNCSAYGLERFTGLSETEAYERALKWESQEASDAH